MKTTKLDGWVKATKSDIELIGTCYPLYRQLDRYFAKGPTFYLEATAEVDKAP